MIRAAVQADEIRIAEILVFAKRVAYRPIFHDDDYLFKELNTWNVLQTLKHDDHQYYVYDDEGMIKAVMSISKTIGNLELHTFYVDPFFQREGIGRTMMLWLFCQNHERMHCWVIQKNEPALRFYQKCGWYPTGEIQKIEGTNEWEVGYEKTI